jgi:hypothetical protein
MLSKLLTNHRFVYSLIFLGMTRVGGVLSGFESILLTHYARNRKFAGSIPDEVNV